MVVKLYEVPNNTQILYEGNELTFGHIDGMFSVCFDKDNVIYHLPAWEEVEIINKLEEGFNKIKTLIESEEGFKEHRYSIPEEENAIEEI